MIQERGLTTPEKSGKYGDGNDFLHRNLFTFITTFEVFYRF